MIINRVFALLSGYLAIQFQGERVERFINLCLQSEIPVWDIHTTRRGTVIGRTSIEGFKRMRPVARKSRVRVHILKRRGLPFLLAKLWQRTAFSLGALLFIVSLYLLGSVIWFVEVRGTEQLPVERITAAARDLGIRPGAWRSGLLAAELSRELVLKVPELSWAGVELRGSVATIQVVEKQLVIADPKPVGHVVASKSGVVSKIVTATGKGMVRTGDTVNKGQVLISGVYQVDADSEIRYVHAEGIVTARVWYEATATSPLRRMIKERTGRVATREVLVIAGRELVLRGPAKPPFALSEQSIQSLPLIWRNLGAAVEHKLMTYYELVDQYQEVGFAEAKAEALAAAGELAQAQVPAGVSIINQVVEAELLPDQNTVSVRVVVETSEPIGVFQAENNAPDQGGN